MPRSGGIEVFSFDMVGSKAIKKCTFKVIFYNIPLPLMKMTPIMSLSLLHSRPPKDQAVLSWCAFISIHHLFYSTNYPHRQKYRNGSPTVKNTWTNSFAWKVSVEVRGRISVSYARVRPCTVVRSVSSKV